MTDRNNSILKDVFAFMQVFLTARNRLQHLGIDRLALNLPQVCSLFATAFVAWLSWGDPGWIWMALLVLPLWVTGSSSRSGLIRLAWAYYGVAMIDLVPVTARFLDESAWAWLSGVMAWLVWSGLLAGLNGLGWHRHMLYRTVSIPLCNALINLPPIGWFSLVSPWTAAGLWTPGRGWLGLLICFAAVCVFSWSLKARSAQAIRMVAISAFAIAVMARLEPTTLTSHGWRSVTTQWGDARLDSASQYQRVQDFVKSVRDLQFDEDFKKMKVIAWPEMGIGLWSARTQFWLSEHQDIRPLPGQVWLIGAAVERIEEGKHAGWVNGFLSWRADESPVFNDGRIPMPIAMWRPGVYISHPFAISTVEVSGAKWGVSICYEDALPWAALQLHFTEVRGVISLGSLWFAKGLNLDRNLGSSAAAWSRLFGVPYVRSVNLGQ